ncbi:MAG: hypothetical protein HRT50_13120 [Colwellia sp.]|nr:hypothetical protein [Colwellia sp.]NQY50018.1 hypothetical protein [Colwellia sp.]
MNNKDISQVALFKGVNSHKEKSKNRSKTMIQSYKEQKLGLKSQSDLTRR